MSRGNPRGLEASIERSCGSMKSGKGASTSSAPWISRLSHEILRDLGMSDDAIAEYFCRFRHGQLEPFFQMVLHKHDGMAGRMITKELHHGQERISRRADGDRDAI